MIVNFFDKKRQDMLSFIKNPELPINVTITQYEAYIVGMATQAIAKLDGDIAEIGVYQGGSARLICKYKGNKTFHLFDTFEGLPDLNKFDTSNEFYKGQFNDTSFELIGKLLNNYPNISIHKGYFPDTAGPVLDKKFSLVNLDVDLHKTTHDALEFFYPRMVKGGIILSHDYVNADGVRKAFDDFFADKPEPVLVVSDTQCLVVKS
jgi:O-methyltransferase